MKNTFQVGMEDSGDGELYGAWHPKVSLELCFIF